MRIGFIIYGDLGTMTGGYLYDRIMVDGLRASGHEVEVISLRSGTYLSKLIIGFSPGMSRRLLAGKFDVIIEDELCHPSLFWVNRRLRRQRGPTLLAVVHHALCREPRYHWQNAFLSVAERLFLASVDGFILNSRSTERSVASLAGGRQPRVIAYPSGDRFGSALSKEAISERAQKSGPLELLFLGNVIPRKGLQPLLEALDGVAPERWHLSIVGGLDFAPGYVAGVRRFISQRSLSDSISFLGLLLDESLAEVLGRSHIFCMPYAYEGFGIAILEGMAFGLPAFGCEEGAASETIRHGINGFLFSSADTAGLKTLIVKFHQDREKLQQLSLAARETFLSRPGWKESIETIDKFLRQMTGLQEQKAGAGVSSDVCGPGRGKIP